MSERVGPPRSAILLVNQKARRGDAGLADVVARLRAGGVAVEEAGTREAGGLEAALGLAGDADCVIVGGGDGTLCHAAPALMAAGLPLGLLPMGTANDLARTLGIPDDLEAAADVILAGHRRRIDLGSVNGKPFFNVASIGLSSELAHELSADLKRRWGRAGYALAALRVLLRARRFSAWVREGETTVQVHTLQVAVGNGVFYGGGAVVAEGATIDDGHLDLYSLEMQTVWRLMLMARSFRGGSHGAWSEVRTARGTEFEIRTRKPRAVNADGELITETPAVFRVHPGAVTVFAAPP